MYSRDGQRSNLIGPNQEGRITPKRGYLYLSTTIMYWNWRNTGAKANAIAWNLYKKLELKIETDRNTFQSFSTSDDTLVSPLGSVEA